MNTLCWQDSRSDVGVSGRAWRIHVIHRRDETTMNVRPFPRLLNGICTDQYYSDFAYSTSSFINTRNPWNVWTMQQPNS